MTWSPFLRLATPGPTSTTIPAPSWPRIAGNSPSGSAPDSVYASVWQIPLAFTSTSTSPAFGPSSRTVSIARGWPALWATAARVSMDHLCVDTTNRPLSSNITRWLLVSEFLDGPGIDVAATLAYVTAYANG